jgi:NAD(P)-dependent dehydrogenase (short-subunit alcohol dehydrogenase family)
VITENTKIGQSQNFEMYERHHLTPYLGAPADLAAMATFLASDDGRFVSGQVVRVDGGVTSHFAHVAENRPAFDAYVAAQAKH